MTHDERNELHRVTEQAMDAVATVSDSAKAISKNVKAVTVWGGLWRVCSKDHRVYVGTDLAEAIEDMENEMMAKESPSP